MGAVGRRQGVEGRVLPIMAGVIDAVKSLIQEMMQFMRLRSSLQW